MSRYKNRYCVIDIETASDVDITAGVMRYAASKQFHILTIAYKIDDEDVKVLTNFERKQKAPDVPDELLNFDGYFVAHNWFFEYTCLCFAYRNVTPIWKIFSDTRRWLCTAALSRYFAVDAHGKLEVVAERLGLPHKLHDGKRLIDIYSKPNLYGKFETISAIDREAWIEYNKRDVEITAEIFEKLFPKWPSFERKLWQAHKEIAVEGIPIDTNAAKILQRQTEKVKTEAETAAEKIAGRTEGGALVLTSQKEFIAYLREKFNVKIPDAKEATLKTLYGISSELDYVLQLRKILSARATDKTEQILERVFAKRIFDAFVYCGAHTGRWASWGVNFFNFSRENCPTDDDYENLLTKQNMTLEEIKALQRGLVCPQDKTMKLIISDFKSIELHLLLYCAEDYKQLEILESGKSLYSYFGEKAFRKKVEKGTKEYQIAKSAVLGLGYGAGATVFSKLAGIDIETSKHVAAIWREHNHKTVDFWQKVETAFRRVAAGYDVAVKLPRNIVVAKTDDGRGVKIVMPNGFEMFYPIVKIADDAVLCSWDSGITFHRLWGGQLTENIMQSLCRQLLADSLIELRKADVKVILHVYDEIVCYAITDVKKTAKKIADIMTKERAWLPDFHPQIEQTIRRRWGK